MCKSFGKDWSDYIILKSTNKILNELNIYKNKRYISAGSIILTGAANI
jgi:RNA polymerase subunit RPABC4/transcription elongation factor Spt4